MSKKVTGILIILSIIGIMLGYSIPNDGIRILSKIILAILLIFYFGKPKDETEEKYDNSSEVKAFDIAFVLLGYLIRLKGNVNRNDVDAVNAYFDFHRIDTNTRTHFIEMLNFSRNKTIDVDSLLATFLKTPPQLKYLCGLTLIEIIVSCSNGMPDRQTLSELKKICKSLDFTEQKVNAYIDTLIQQNNQDSSNQQKEQAKDKSKEKSEEEFKSRQSEGNYRSANSGPMTLSNAYLELGIAYEADEKTAKRAYLKLIKEYHPDKFAASPNYIQEDMSAKAKRINAAWDMIRKHKNWR